MEYLNVTLRLLRSAEFAGMDTKALGTWLRVCAYCADQENGGRIKGAAEWEDDAWKFSCKVSARDVEDAAPLLAVVEGDVVALGYPSYQETECIAKRNGGRRGAEKRWGKPQDSQWDSHKDTHKLSECVKEGKVKEGKGTDSLTYRVELFLSCHDACSACNRMAVENMIRSADLTPEQFGEALNAFSTQWAGSDFPASIPPLKEFSKYLRRAGGGFTKKETDSAAESKPPRFDPENRS